MRTWIVKQLFQVSSGLWQRGKGVETKTLCKHLRHRQNLQKNLERKAELAERGDKLALQRLYEAEADVEVKLWEKRNSDIALCEINREFGSRFQLQQANQWTDQAEKDKISLYGELEMRNRLFRENQAKDCQEIEEVRKIRCEERDRARQARTDELSVHQARNPTTVNQLFAQIQDYQNNVKFHVRCERIVRS